MIFGYARTSTTDQKASLAHQRDTLGKLCDTVVYEESSAVGERPRLEATLAALREGDKLVVTTLTRLARNVMHLGQIVKEIEERGASLEILDMKIDTSLATGKLMLNLLGSVAEFERSMMLERQKIGIAKAKAEGKYKGKKRSFSDKRLKELVDRGLNPTQIAEELGVSRQGVHKRLKQLTA